MRRKRKSKENKVSAIILLEIVYNRTYNFAQAPTKYFNRFSTSSLMESNEAGNPETLESSLA